jgi:KaiC/GvpD/RAD55 family RecA-like ATPase
MVLAHKNKIIKKEKEKKMIIEEMEVISKLQKRLREAYQAIGNNILAGGIDNMEKYKYMLGQAHAYQYISQEISNLLNPKEQKNDNKGQDNILKFDAKN